MVESGSESAAESFTESAPQLSFQASERDILTFAEKVTAKQYKAAKALIEESISKKFSQEHLIEQVCVLMASSFKEGINLTLKTYELK